MKMTHKTPSLLLGIGGTLTMLLIAAIRYAAGQPMDFFSYCFAFFLGATVIWFTMDPYPTFVGKLVPVSALIGLIWMLLNPIASVGDTWIIKKMEIAAFILLAIFLLHRTAVVSFTKNKSWLPGAFGWLILNAVVGIAFGKIFWDWAMQNFAIFVTALAISIIITMTISYFTLKGQIKKLGGFLGR